MVFFWEVLLAVLLDRAVFAFFIAEEAYGHPPLGVPVNVFPHVASPAFVLYRSADLRERGRLSSCPLRATDNMFSECPRDNRVSLSRPKDRRKPFVGCLASLSVPDDHT